MTTSEQVILCVGTEPDLLILRCAVLKTSGFDAQPALVKGAQKLLQTQHFDLVIFSSRLSENDQARILSAAGSTPTLALEGLTLPSALLAEVEKRLSPMSRVG